MKTVDQILNTDYQYTTYTHTHTHAYAHTFRAAPPQYRCRNNWGSNTKHILLTRTVLHIRLACLLARPLTHTSCFPRNRSCPKTSRSSRSSLSRRASHNVSATTPRCAILRTENKNTICSTRKSRIENGMFQNCRPRQP